MLDLKKTATQQATMEAFFFAYQAFTAKADEMLARRGLSRLHQRILFFIGKYPGTNMKELLAYLGVSKQALSVPLRQLLEMRLVESLTAAEDKRKRVLAFTAAGAKLELSLRREQVKLLQRAFDMAGADAASAWLEVNKALGQGL
jgi:DNA-binding MarR family transcriptional regulator